MASTLRIAFGSLGISLVVLGLKSGAWWLTGSVALASDALETVINVAAAGVAVFAIWYGARPADENHPYGHRKAEYLSAVVEGALVLATALAIAQQAWQGWEHPHVPQTPLLGIALGGVGGVINLGWAMVLLGAGRRRRSPALLASGRHVLSDVWTTAGVLAGFALVPVTGWLRIDPLLAALVAANVLWSGYVMLRHSVGGLMDEVTDHDRLLAIRETISCHAEGAVEAHDVRTRVVGPVTFMEFHLVVPARMAVEDAHAICDRIERALRERVGEAVINIHVEPEGKAKHRGIVVVS